jgi:3-oxoadipate enol-lactonase/4-carboxymuconolactone decarboxylase
MPFAVNNGVRLYWRSDGHADKPAVVFLNSLGTDFAMWAGVVVPVVEKFRVIRMDARGHGASDAPPGSYSIPLLAQDVLAVMNAAGVQKAHLCGLSVGGMIALELAATAPERVMKVVACNTSAQQPPEPWLQRAATVREKGLQAIEDMVMHRYFSDSFLAANSPRIGTARTTLLSLSPGGYAACCEAIGRLDIWDRLASIKAPLLVINGAKDTATPPEHGDRIAQAVSGARVKVLDAAHLSAVEAPKEFAEALLGFLQVNRES